MFDRHDIVNEADFVPIMYSLLYRVSFKKYMLLDVPCGAESSRPRLPPSNGGVYRGIRFCAKPQRLALKDAPDPNRE